MEQLNFRQNNLTNTHVFSNDNATNKTIAKAIITFCAFFFSAGSFNLGRKNNLLNGFTNLSKNNTYHSNTFSMSISSFENISEKSTIFEEGGNVMSINDKEFGALEQKVAGHDKLGDSIKERLDTIAADIKTINEQTSKIKSSDEIKDLIKAGINESKIKTIKWIIGTGISLGVLTIAALALAANIIINALK